MPRTITFWVPGCPQPGGSKRGFYIKTIKRVVITEANPKAKDWRSTVAQVAAEHIKEPFMCAVAIKFEFFYQRPKSHFGSKGLRPSAPKFHTSKPDSTKLTRSTEDAMKGICWRDDSQVVEQHITKAYADQAGAWITIVEVI